MNEQLPARFHSADLTCPPTRWSDATTTLRHFAIITYAVDPAALRALLPAGFSPEVRVLDDGRDVAFVSAVPFVDIDFRAHFAPFYKIHMGQTNYRAYVWYGGQRAVWFFGTTLAGPWLWVPRHFWNLPWHAASIAVDAQYGPQGHCREYTMAATSDWGAAQLEMRGSSAPMGRLDGFADEEDTAVVLTHPLVGYFRRRDGALGSYSVWHDRLALHRADVVHARFDVFERLGLFATGTPPHSALIQRETEFTIFLPPRRV